MTANLLETIVASVRQDLSGRMRFNPLASLVRECGSPMLPATRGFRRALMRDDINIIAEVKRASPSKGRFPARLAPRQQGLEYERAGAACISVVTEPKFFEGSLELLSDLHTNLSLPLLRKDFIIDAYQIYEARLAGADAILLIVAILEDSQLRELAVVAGELGMDVLVEVSNAGELERALAAGAEMVGVNNRNLQDFSTDLERSLRLAASIPREVTAVSESGIHNSSQIDELRAAGYRAFLIGEYLMRQENPGQALRQLRSGYSPRVLSS